jgi:hypothetical protein
MGSRNPQKLNRERLARAAARKIWLNLKSGVEKNALSSKEKHAFVKEIGLTEPVWIRTGQLAECLRIARPLQVVSFFPMHQARFRLSAHPTFDFVRETLDGRHWSETTLYRNGLRPEIDWPAYAERCRTLAESIRATGLMPYPGRALQNICVYVDQTGRPLHFKRGHHRLAIAHALNLERIPVAVIGISAQHLRKFTPLWSLDKFGALKRAIHSCMAELAAR